MFAYIVKRYVNGAGGFLRLDENNMPCWTDDIRSATFFSSKEVGIEEAIFAEDENNDLKWKVIKTRIEEIGSVALSNSIVDEVFPDEV